MGEVPVTTGGGTVTQERAEVRLSSPGAFGSRWGEMTPAGVIAGHVVYGLVLGLVLLQHAVGVVTLARIVGVGHPRAPVTGCARVDTSEPRTPAALAGTAATWWPHRRPAEQLLNRSGRHRGLRLAAPPARVMSTLQRGVLEKLLAGS